MELVIGGAYQGKQDVTVRIFELNPSEILNGANCSLQEALQARAIRNFHLLIRSMMEKKQSPEEFFEQLKDQNPDVILISNEVGYGIVPLERFEREWRETTGRICCMAAQEAIHVIRVVAGNAVYIKGEK